MTRYLSLHPDRNIDSRSSSSDHYLQTNKNRKKIVHPQQWPISINRVLSQLEHPKGHKLCSRQKKKRLLSRPLSLFSTPFRGHFYKSREVSPEWRFHWRKKFESIILIGATTQVSTLWRCSFVRITIVSKWILNWTNCRFYKESKVVNSLWAPLQAFWASINIRKSLTSEKLNR